MIPVVSVVLPFRNAAATIVKAVQSILDQSFEDFELILIDNASTDKSREMAERFLSDHRTRILDEPRVGVVHAANRGLQASRGEFICRMDADDWSYPDRITKQVAWLNDHPEFDLVSGKVEFMTQPTEGFERYLDWVNSVTTHEEIELNQFVEFPLVNPSVMFRRSLVEKFGGFRAGDFPEDYEFFLRLKRANIKMGKVSSTVLKWNDLPSRLTRTGTNYSDEAFNRIKANYLAQRLKALDTAIWVWGAGAAARKKCSLLEAHSIPISGFIEVSDQKISGNKPVIHFSQLPAKPDRLVLSYVGNWGAREEIRQYLTHLGWTEGTDFILAS